MVRNVIIELQTPRGKIVYVDITIRGELLASVQHRLRVKSAINDCIVVSYHPEMNFDNAIAAGFTITTDNR